MKCGFKDEKNIKKLKQHGNLFVTKSNKYLYKMFHVVQYMNWMSMDV